MGILQDLLTDINRYADGNVSLEIDMLPVPVQPGEPADSVLNVGETRQFRVTVDNTGNLHMKALRLQVEGSKWADVATSENGTFAADFLSSGLDVDARSKVTFGPFALRAKTNTNNGAKNIVRSHIKHFDADLEHILSGMRHESDMPEAMLSREVFPS